MQTIHRTSTAFICKIAAALFGGITITLLLQGSSAARLYCILVPAASIISLLFDQGRSELILREGFTRSDQKLLTAYRNILFVTMLIVVFWGSNSLLLEVPRNFAILCILLTALSSCLYDWINRKWVHYCGNLNLLLLAQLISGIAACILAYIGNDVSLLLLSCAPLIIALCIDTIWDSRVSLVYQATRASVMRDKLEAVVSRSLPISAYFISLFFASSLKFGECGGNIVRFSFFSFGLVQLLLIQNHNFKPPFALVLAGVVFAYVLAYVSLAMHPDGAGLSPNALFLPSALLLIAGVSSLYFAALRFQFYFLSKK